jgi:endonuclease G
MKNRHTITISFAFFLLFAPLAGNGHCEFSSLSEALPGGGGKGEIISHSGYTLRYNERHEQAEWVAYRLSAEQLESNIPRSENFRADPKVKTGSAAPSDYKGSGYDRGHLAPAADMKWSKRAMSESFYMSNMSPQAPEFNQGIWNDLEQRVREWAKENDELYVVTGPVLEEGLPAIGENGVSVPRLYFKVILDYREPEYKAAAFLMPNAASPQPIDQYAVTIDSVETLTGLDLFPVLPDSLERALEGSLRPMDWGLTGPVFLAQTEPQSPAGPDTTFEFPGPERNGPRRFTLRQAVVAIVALIIVVIVIWLLFVTIGEATGLFRRKK